MIELTRSKTGAKCTIGLKEITSFEPSMDGKSTFICNNNAATFNVKESYDEVSQLVKKGKKLQRTIILKFPGILTIHEEE